MPYDVLLFPGYERSITSEAVFVVCAMHVACCIVSDVCCMMYGVFGRGLMCCAGFAYIHGACLMMYAV